MSASQQQRVAQRFRAVKRGRADDGGGEPVALEGLWALEHALDAGLEIEEVLVCPPLVRGPATAAVVDRLAAGGITCVEMGERLFRRLVDRDGPDGVAALGRLKAVTLTDLVPDRSARVLVADGGELAGNLGTIIRCADGAGASAVLVTASPLRRSHPLVVKSSMGTVFSMPVIEVTRDEALGWLSDRGLSVVAAHPEAATPYRLADWSPPIAVVVGSERRGVAPFWLEHADAVVSIPMLGVADSLNVGHAAALLLYEALARSVAPR